MALLAHGDPDDGCKITPPGLGSLYRCDGFVLGLATMWRISHGRRKAASLAAIGRKSSGQAAGVT